MPEGVFIVFDDGDGGGHVIPTKALRPWRGYNCSWSSTMLPRALRATGVVGADKTLLSLLSFCLALYSPSVQSQYNEGDVSRSTHRPLAVFKE